MKKSSLVSPRHLVAYAVVIALIVVTTLDIVYEKELENDNIRLTRKLQQWNAGLKAFISVFFGTVGLAWIAIYLVAYFLLHPNNYTHMLYVMTQCLLPLFIIFCLKAVYYRARPFLLAPDIEGCICDPGMPSGHSALAVAIYYLAYSHLNYWYFSQVKNFKKRIALRITTGTILVIITFLVCFSRMMDGEHSYMQLISGFLIGLLTTLFLSYQRFKAGLALVIPRRKLVGALVFFATVGFAIMMIFLNDIRERPDWIHWDGCPLCAGSFIPGQTRSIMVILVVSTWLFGMGIVSYKDPTSPTANRAPVLGQQENRVYENASNKPSANGSTMKADLHSDSATMGPSLLSHCTKKNWIRFGLFLAVTVIPIAPIFLAFEQVINPDLPDRIKFNAVKKSLIYVPVYGVMCLYLGFALTWFKDWIFKKCKVLEERDVLNIDNLDEFRKKQKSPINKVSATDKEVPISIVKVNINAAEEERAIGPNTRQ